MFKSYKEEKYNNFVSKNILINILTIIQKWRRTRETLQKKKEKKETVSY